MSCGPGNTRRLATGSLTITNLADRITFVFEPVPGNQYDMAKLKGSECEMIIKLAGGVFGDKGFIGTGYVTTPVRKRKDRGLYMLCTCASTSTTTRSALIGHRSSGLWPA